MICSRHQIWKPDQERGLERLTSGRKDRLLKMTLLALTEKSFAFNLANVQVSAEISTNKLRASVRMEKSTAPTLTPVPRAATKMIKDWDESPNGSQETFARKDKSSA